MTVDEVTLHSCLPQSRLVLLYIGQHMFTLLFSCLTISSAHFLKHCVKHFFKGETHGPLKHLKSYPKDPSSHFPQYVISILWPMLPPTIYICQVHGNIVHQYYTCRNMTQHKFIALAYAIYNLFFIGIPSHISW